MNDLFLAIDPGTEKCGLALMRRDASVLLRESVPSEKIAERVAEILKQEAGVRTIAVGGGTGSKSIIEKICSSSAPGVEVRKVREYNTTMTARKIYFEENPPRGLLKLLPAGLRVPPRPVDDYAAVAIGRIYIKESGELICPKKER